MCSEVSVNGRGPTYEYLFKLDTEITKESFIVMCIDVAIDHDLETSRYDNNIAYDLQNIADRVRDVVEILWDGLVEEHRTVS